MWAELESTEKEGTIPAERLATEALKVMQANHVNGLLVTDADGVLTGALNMHDLLMARIV